MFGKRKKWNGEVAQLIEELYGIQRRGNPDWPGIIAELDFLDGAFRAGQNSNEAALMMVVSLFCGYVDNGHMEEAREMYPGMMSVAKIQVSNGLIRPNHWERFSRHIEECRAIIESNRPVSSSNKQTTVAASVINCPTCKGRVSRQESNPQHCRSCGASFVDGLD